MTQIGLLEPDHVHLNDSDTANTPRWLCDRIVKVMGVPDVDICTNDAAYMPAARKWTKREDCFSQTLDPLWTAWCNPPYSNPGPFLGLLKGQQARSLALVKHDHSTRWWAENVKNRNIVQLNSRLAFERPGRSAGVANFPSTLVAFGGWTRRQLIEAFWDLGEIR